MPYDGSVPRTGLFPALRTCGTDGWMDENVLSSFDNKCSVIGLVCKRNLLNVWVTLSAIPHEYTAKDVGVQLSTVE